MDAEQRALKERCDRAFSKMAANLRKLIDDFEARKAAGLPVETEDLSHLPVVDLGRENIVAFHGKPPKPAKK